MIEIENQTTTRTTYDYASFEEYATAFRWLETDELALITKIDDTQPLYDSIFQELIRRSHKLIVDIITNYFHWAPFERQEMYDIAIIGLHNAIRTWRCEQGSTFSSVVFYNVRKAIRRAITRSGYFIALPGTTEANIDLDDDESALSKAVKLAKDGFIPIDEDIDTHRELSPPDVGSKVLSIMEENLDPTVFAFIRSTLLMGKHGFCIGYGLSIDKAHKLEEWIIDGTIIIDEPAA